MKQFVSIMMAYVSIALVFYKSDSFAAGVSKSIIFIVFDGELMLIALCHYTHLQSYVRRTTTHIMIADVTHLQS